MEKNSRKVGRYPAIEGMRGLAALYVVLGHIGSMVDPLGTRAIQAKSMWAPVMKPFSYGHMAVAAFIVISGFCMQMSCLRADESGRCRDQRAFFRARMRRILPPYYACLVCSLLVCYLVTQRHSGLPWSQYVPVSVPAFVAHLAFVHNWSPDWMYKINGVLWSIGIEFQLYLLVPALAGWAAKREYWKPILLASLFLGLPLAVATLTKLYLWYGALFILGLFTARLTFMGAPGRNWTAWLLTVGALIAGCFLNAATKNQIPSDVAFGLGVAGLLYLSVRCERPLPLLASRPVVALGVMSYSLYLIHHPLLQVVAHVRRVGQSTVTQEFREMFLLGLPFILIGAALFYWCFERPFTKSRTA